jgi:2,3-bisphosphoglycerate-independent phosphoglycerate mutase
MGKPVVLCILDGWGIGTSPVANAPALAKVPNFNRIWAECPHAQLITHGPDAGLPRGQMGNSEVGHTNIGAGRVVAMDLGAIDLAVEDGSFATNEALVAMIATLKENGGTAHLMGVVSDGGVHGHITHLIAAMLAFTEAGVPVAIHAITDGRDVPPSSAAGFMAQLTAALTPGASIATVIGRYWAMDRDNRWSAAPLPPWFTVWATMPPMPPVPSPPPMRAARRMSSSPQPSLQASAACQMAMACSA